MDREATSPTRKKNESSAFVSGNRRRVRRYRGIHRRIDYVPSPDVLQVIQHHIKIGTDCCLAGVIDYLVRSGQAAITGNGGK
jgi:hypothetical protein